MSHTNSENKPYGSSIPFQLSNDQDPSSFGISPSDINMTFWSNGSSFSSSASGSGAGGSFSSVDNLPSISRDFVRPSDNDTRRPATAGGALQQPSRTMFTSGLEATIQEEDGNENDHSGGNSRRASVPHDSWLNHGTSMPSITPYNQFVMTQQHAQGNPARNTNQVLRPQTSDGLPHHTLVPSLPSLNSHVQYTGTMAPRTIPNAIPNMGYSSFPGDRTFSFAGVQPQFVNGNVDGPSSYPGMDARKHTFVAADEDRPKAKRPRRRADEITRKYKCGWNGCDKGYGTLNHLNAHVETLKHGEKRTSDEFKWIKEENKTIKQRAAAEAARNKSARPGASRGSFSSESDYTRRDSAVSGYSSADYSGRSSATSGYDFMYSRPGTAGSMASFDGNASGGYADQFAFGGSMNRRPSAPMHIPLPPPRPMNQDFGLLGGNQFVNGDHLTPTNQYPHSHLNLGEYRPPAQNSTIAMTSAQPLEKPFEQFSFQR